MQEIEDSTDPRRGLCSLGIRHDVADICEGLDPFGRGETTCENAPGVVGVRCGKDARIAVVVPRRERGSGAISEEREGCRDGSADYGFSYLIQHCLLVRRSVSPEIGF